ncbi:hypothetical protein D9M68_893830 [compost metagenome]
MQRQRRVQRLGVFGEPGRQLAGHLAHRVHLASLGHGQAFAQQVEHHAVLHDVVVGRGEAGALHPLVFVAKVAHGVGDDGGPGLRQCRVGRVLRRRQQVHELPVHGVHGLVIQ